MFRFSDGVSCGEFCTCLLDDTVFVDLLDVNISEFELRWRDVYKSARLAVFESRFLDWSGVSVCEETKRFYSFLKLKLERLCSRLLIQSGFDCAYGSGPARDEMKT